MREKDQGTSRAVLCTAAFARPEGVGLTDAASQPSANEVWRGGKAKDESGEQCF